MHQGHGLAVDTPSTLKGSMLPGPAWDIAADPLLPALERLEQMPGVSQVGLRGDHLHAITRDGTHTAETSNAALGSLGASATIEPAESSLEDVFVALAGGRS